MTSISKDVLIVNSHDIVNKQNNAYHVTIKMKPVDVKSNTYISFSEENDREDPNFKIGDVKILQHQNIKTFLQKSMFQIGLKKFSLLQKLIKRLCRGHM